MANSTDKLTRRWMLRQAKNPEVIYLGLFLSSMDQKKLIKKFGKKYSEVHAEHMTIWHFQDGGDPKIETLPIGKSFPLKITGYVEDEKAQAIILQPPSKFKPKSGRTAHITLTLASGVGPKYSNDLIAREGRKSTQKGLPTVTGKLGWFDGEKARYDLPTA